MVGQRFQYRLWTLHVVVASVALVLGAALGGLVRAALAISSAVFVAAMAAAFFAAIVGHACHSVAVMPGYALRIIRLPLRVRQFAFERRLARIRPGNSSQLVRRQLGAPTRVDGFGDRLYWSYRIAGRRYTVSFDPRRLVAKYSNGLSRDTRTV